MNAQIKKIDTLVRKHLHQSKIVLMIVYGIPEKVLDDDIWIYTWNKYFFFKTKTVFIFKNDRVTDIIIFEYIFRIHFRDSFYNANHTPKYEVVKYY
ncbi:hypothetical protein [Epilithonimonas hungarica]|uniref:Uncharacterized protein n=1 Tax=Epilithonimonas hungarica TaxID=454006 RepID=A0A1G7HW25_9FLAO|nr:hypothetical protein [Epilithonimonas hungarica]SDF04642.1 hypothetical protein SAMN05421825_0917 [Epilithonimonas hungarica]